MALRSDWSEELCPVRRGLDVLGDPWVLLIIRDVLHGRHRFTDMRANLGISDAVLSRRLDEMVAAGLLRREPYQDGGRSRDEYHATEAGADLLPILQMLALWGEKHTAMPAGGQHMAMMHERCGQETTTAELCSACGLPLEPDDMTWVKPWLGEVHHLVGTGAPTAG